MKASSWWSLCLLLLAAQPATAELVSSLSTTAQTSVVWNGVTQDFDADNTAPNGNVSSSASGTSFDGSAQAFVDASNFGHLKISGGSAITLISGTGQSTAFSRVAIQDSWLLNKLNFEGQAGVATVSLLITGSWDAPGDWGQINTGLEIGILGVGTVNTLFNYTGLLAARVNQPSSETCRVDGVASQCFGLFTFEIPFVFGQEMDMRYLLDGRSAVAPGNLAGIPRSGSPSFDLAHSVFWGGISSVTVGGEVVTEYDFDSGSGFDWRTSSIPTNGAPEPGTLALLGLGLAGLAATRRRKQ